jgi:hypothetical protein
MWLFRRWYAQEANYKMGRCFFLRLIQCQNIIFTCELYKCKCKTAMDKIQEWTSIKTHNMKHIRVVSLFVTNHRSSLINVGTPLNHLSLILESGFILILLKIHSFKVHYYSTCWSVGHKFSWIFFFWCVLFIKKHIRWARIHAIHVRWFSIKLSYD